MNNGITYQPQLVSLPDFSHQQYGEEGRGFGGEVVALVLLFCNLSSVFIKTPGWLFYKEDEKLPSYIGIIMSHYKDPYYEPECGV